ncbi:unnamed protein product [Caretta caretta]
MVASKEFSLGLRLEFKCPRELGIFARKKNGSTKSSGGFCILLCLKDCLLQNFCSFQKDYQFGTQGPKPRKWKHYPLHHQGSPQPANADDYDELVKYAQSLILL